MPFKMHKIIKKISRKKSSKKKYVYMCVLSDRFIPKTHLFFYLAFILNGMCIAYEKTQQN